MRTPCRMLFIEDDDLDQMAFERMVREKALPYDLVIVESLAEARARLGESHFDVIVADYGLPDGRSPELFDEVKDTPFIVLTGTLDEQMALRTLESGADDYLIKDAKRAYLAALPFAVGKTLRRKQIREREQRLARELETELAAMKRLQGLSTLLLEQNDVQRLLDTALDSAIAVAGADKGILQLLDGSESRLEVVVHRGLAPAFFEYLSNIHSGFGACATVLATKERVIVEDVQRSPVFAHAPTREAMLAAGTRAVISTPLLCRTGQLLGVLSVGFAAPHRVTERELHVLDLLVRQTSDFIENHQSQAALQKAKEQLTQSNRELEQKVQERTAKLRETIAELEHFSYTIAHDMRAPLRAMQNFTHLLLDGDLAAGLGEVARDYLGRIQMAAGRMDKLITDALQYSRTLRGEFPVAPLDLARILRGIIETYPDLQPPRAQVHLEGDFPPVLGSEAGVTQCFSNLLGNAVKFVEPGKLPEVCIWAEDREGYVRFWVQDNGIGIPREYQDRIWDMFQILDKAHRGTGTGIGLALVRKVVERMGGRTGVESAPGRGSRFWVELKPVD